MAGCGDFAEDEERAVGFDLDRDRGLADVTVAEARGDFTGETRRGAAAGRHSTDQRHGDRTAGIDGIAVGEAFLAVDHDAQPVAGVEMIGGVVAHRRRHRRGVADRHGCRRRGKGIAQRADGAATVGDDDRLWCAIGLTIGHGVEIGTGLHDRDGTGGLHAAAEGKRGGRCQGGCQDRPSKHACNRHRTYPSKRDGPVLHRLWLTKR